MQGNNIISYFSTIDLDVVQGIDSVEQVRNQETISQMIRMKLGKIHCRAVSGVEPLLMEELCGLKGHKWDKGWFKIF